MHTIFRFFKINYLLQHLMCHFTVQFRLTSPRHCALNVVSVILTEGTSLKQIIKIRDLVNTFKN